MKRLVHSFTARKIMELLLTLLIVTFLSFLLVKLSPVDAAEAMPGELLCYTRRSSLVSFGRRWGSISHFWSSTEHGWEMRSTLTLGPHW